MPAQSDSQPCCVCGEPSVEVLEWCVNPDGVSPKNLPEQWYCGFHSEIGKAAYQQGFLNGIESLVSMTMTGRNYQ